MVVGQNELAEEFSRHRCALLDVAYRLTSSLSDAEDAVQESWLRLSTLDPARRDEIRDLRGWLTTTVSRICLDRLRSAAVRRERYVGPWLPEPLVTTSGTGHGEDPLDVIVRDDGVRMAAMVVLDRLPPEQRVAFVLHDAFSVPFAEIAETLGCSPAAARQHASRARRTVTEADPPPRASLDEQREVLERFLGALANGDVSAVVDLLHPDIAFVGDANGKARTARRSLEGAEKVARFVLGLLARYGPTAATAGRLVLVNGDVGLALPDVPGEDGRWALTRRVSAFSMRDGRIVAIYDVANPDKLTYLPD